jgi:hypothetical protein
MVFIQSQSANRAPTTTEEQGLAWLRDELESLRRHLNAVLRRHQFVP